MAHINFELESEVGIRTYCNKRLSKRKDSFYMLIVNQIFNVLFSEKNYKYEIIKIRTTNSRQF